MRYSDITPSMRMFLGAFEALRKVGFAADDIYCMTSLSVKLHGALGIFCVLRAQGKEFSIDCGPVESEEAAQSEYQRVSTAVSTGGLDPADHDRIWRESEACQRYGHLCAALVAKGFTLPVETTR
jgi:hypothetical protein